MSLAFDKDKSEDIVLRNRSHVAKGGHKSVRVWEEISNFELVGDRVIRDLRVRDFLVGRREGISTDS